MASITDIFETPFFIFYDARSGSTYLANLLIKRLNVAILPESDFVPDILRKYPDSKINDSQELQRLFDILARDRKFPDLRIDYESIKKNISYPISKKEFIKLICTLFHNQYFPDAVRIGFKKNNYINKYEQIKNIFPDCQSIGIIRDGRAVYNSKKNSVYSKTGRPFQTDPKKAAKEWLKGNRRISEVRKKYNDMLIVYYEDLILHTEKVLESISNHLDIDLHEINDNKAYYVADRYGALHENINKEPLVSRIEAWKNSLTNDEIFIYEAATYRHLKRHNYELINKEEILENKFQKLRRYVSFNFKKIAR